MRSIILGSVWWAQVLVGSSRRGIKAPSGSRVLYSSGIINKMQSLLLLLGGGMVIRTYDRHKKTYIPQFLHAIIGPHYYLTPPRNIFK